MRTQRRERPMRAADFASAMKLQIERGAFKWHGTAQKFGDVCVAVLSEQAFKGLHLAIKFERHEPTGTPQTQDYFEEDYADGKDHTKRKIEMTTYLVNKPQIESLDDLQGRNVPYCRHHDSISGMGLMGDGCQVQSICRLNQRLYQIIRSLNIHKSMCKDSDVKVA